MSEPVGTMTTRDKSNGRTAEIPRVLFHRSKNRSPHAGILALQRAAGNQATSHLVRPIANQETVASERVPPIVKDVLRSARGHPIDPDLRYFMEERFGYDFSGVRLHTDGRASQSAMAVNASAYAVGQHIILDGTQYSPRSDAGFRLLAHELAHVIQQSRGGPGSPTPLLGSRLEQAANHAASTISLEGGNVQVEGALAPGIARQPRALSQSLNPGALTDPELTREMNLIRQWLEENRGASSERNQLLVVLNALALEAGKRRLAVYERAIGPLGETALAGLVPGGKLTLQTAKLGAGFTNGFLIGALLAIPAKAYSDLSTELSEPLNNLLFGLGIQAGIPVGAGKELLDNIEGLLELAKFAFWYLTPIGQALRGVKEFVSLVRDPAAYRARKAEEAAQYREILSGMWELIKRIEGDPAFLLETGETLGVQVGGAAGSWFTDTFMAMTPFRKGMQAGEIAGRIIFEVALLFVGPEEWIARGALALGQAAKATRVARIVLEAIEHIPVLRRILAVRRVAEAGEVVRAAERVAEAERAVAAPAAELGKGGEAVRAPARAVGGGETAAAKPVEESVQQVTRATGEERLPMEPTKPPETGAEMTAELKQSIKERGLPLGEPEVPATAPVTGVQRFERVGEVKVPPKPRGFGKTPEGALERAKPGRRVKPGTLKRLEPTIREPARKPPPNWLTTYLQRHNLTFGTEGRAAREAFDAARPEFAKALGAKPNEHIHHAVELQVLDYYPDVFKAEELNTLQNLRGIPEEPLVPGGPPGEQLHNSLVRKMLDERYAALDEEIQKGGYLPGYPDYNALVRRRIEEAKEAVDKAYGHLFRWPKPGARVLGFVSGLAKAGIATSSATGQPATSQ